jgi:phosphoribosylaminoimidazolecarboxamide formyltransferase/IMP cyclohydrolase
VIVAIERALISVFDKTGIADFARELSSLGIEILSTGGTARLLRDAGLEVRDVSDFTGWPEMLGGRVKTLHPRVHGGILFRRGSVDDAEEVEQHNLQSIDMVVVNLYPFEATSMLPHLEPEMLVENIDIGGPAMLRSAAKNFRDVVVLTDPADYVKFLAEFKVSRSVSLGLRLDLARQVFAATSRYDGIIAAELERLADNRGELELTERAALPERLHLALRRQQELRYGENPHQQAGLYVPAGQPMAGLAAAEQLQGKELSYNNLVDLDAAWRLVEEFSRPAAVIIKHNNPCGAAEQDSQAEAYLRALECDPVSAFGGVLAFNRPLDARTAEEVAKLFVECVVAPDFESAALGALAAKKNLRLMRMTLTGDEAAPELKRISGGVLVQQPDRHRLSERDWKVVTGRAPSEGEREALLFAWKVTAHVKSNAIVFARGGATLGVGAGQMSRVDSVKVAVMKAAAAGRDLAGSVVGSDAFFPFPDGVEEAARAGATAVIQPGGSVRDADVIAAANRLGLAMVFTGVRHFLH